MFKAVRRLTSFVPVPTRRQTARPATPEPDSLQAPANDQPSVEPSVEGAGKTLYATMQETSGQGPSDSPSVAYTHPVEGSSSTAETAPVAAEEPVKAQVEPEPTVPEPQPTVVDDAPQAEPDVTLVDIEPQVTGKEAEPSMVVDDEVHQVPFQIGATSGQQDEVHEIRVDESDDIKVALGEDKSEPAPVPDVQVHHHNEVVVAREPEPEPTPAPVPPPKEEPVVESHAIEAEAQQPPAPEQPQVNWAQDLTEEPQDASEESLVHALDAENPFGDQASTTFPVMMPVPSIPAEFHGGYQPPPIFMPQLHASSSTRASTPSANLNEVASRTVGAQEADYQQPLVNQGPNGFVNVSGYNVENDYDESRPLLDRSIERPEDKVIEPDVDKLIQGLFPTFTMPIPTTEPTREVAAPEFPTPHSPTTKPALPVYHTLGWSEHQLPDSTCYYYNPSVSTCVDMDLRNPELLHALSTHMSRPTHQPSPASPSSGGFFLQSLIPGEDDLVDLGQIRERRPPPPEGVELWLQHKKQRSPFTSTSGRPLTLEPTRTWVHHKTRTASDEDPVDTAAKGKGVEPDEEGLLEQERLEATARYWKFMESHPAHAPLPANAREEALEALTWSYTDKLMNPSRPPSGPFTPEETQELLTLLRNTDPNSPLQRTIHTRIVSKVHLRLIEWRQAKAGYKSVAKLRSLNSVRGQIERRGFPFRRTMLNLVMTFLCWGIPYLYLEHEASMQHEYNSAMAAGAHQGRETRALLFGASVSLTAAIILSASVSFLSVKGIDGSMRVAALVASLCAAASLASGFITIYRQRPFMMPQAPTPTVAAPAQNAENADSESLIVLSVRASLVLPSGVVAAAISSSSPSLSLS